MLRPIAILLLVVGLVAPLHAQQPYTRLEPTSKEIEGSLRTDWYGVYFQDKKIGYYKTARERTADGIRESVYIHMKLLSFGQKTEMIISQSFLFEAKAPHSLVKATYKEDAGGVPSEFELTRDKAGKFDVVQTVGKNVRKKNAEAIDFTLGDSLATELWIKRGPSKGSESVVRDLEVKEQKLDSQSNKILDSKTSLVAGVDVKFYEVESESSRDHIKVVSRHDDQGKMLSGKIANVFELRFETEAQAKNAEYSKDLFLFGMAKVDRKLGDLKQVKELVLEVDGPPNVFADGPRQSVAKSDEGKTQLRLGKRFGNGVKATPEEIADSLKETAVYDLSDPKVKALAKKAVGDAATDEEKVKNISRFVHGYVVGKFGNTMPTIHDLIERKEGDCKSYALLFTTLARASGVPSREVAGLLYVGDSGKAFGGHAWNEVVLNGVWVPVDASLDETEVNATHLSFGTDKTAAKNMLETMGNLKLRVVEVKTK